jgi:hypothetical protein
MHKDEVFWVSPDGVLTQLVMDAGDAMRMGKRNFVDQQLFDVHQRMQVLEVRKKGKSPAISMRQQETLKQHDKPRRQRNAPTKHQATYRAIEASLDILTGTEDRTATYFNEDVTATPAGPALLPAAQGQSFSAAAPTASKVKPVKATSKASGQFPRIPLTSPNWPGLSEAFSSADRWEDEDE